MQELRNVLAAMGAHLRVRAQRLPGNILMQSHRCPPAVLAPLPHADQGQNGASAQVRVPTRAVPKLKSQLG